MKNLLYSCCIIISCCSCTYIYYPTHPVIPDIKETGLGVETSIGPTGVQLSSWYTFNKHFYLVANGSADMSLKNDGDSIKRRHYNSITGLGGVGLKFKVSQNCDIHLQSGVGHSKGYFRTSLFDDNSYDKPYSGYYRIVNVKSQSFRYYLQPVIGLRRKDAHAGIFFIPKLTYESFKLVEVNPTFGFNKNYKNIRPLKTIDVWVYEFHLLMRFEVEKNLLLDLNFGLSTDFSKRSGSEPNNLLANMYVSCPLLIRLGLCKQF